MSLLNFIFKVFNENVNGTRQLILVDTVKTISRHCKLSFFVVAFGLLVYGFYPFYNFYFNGNLTLICPMVLPFVDKNTLRGYLILTSEKIFNGAWAVLFTFGFSCVFLVCVDVYDGLVSLVEYDFKEIDFLWEKKEPFICEKRKLAFKNIMTELEDLLR